MKTAPIFVAALLLADVAAAQILVVSAHRSEPPPEVTFEVSTTPAPAEVKPPTMAEPTAAEAMLKWSNTIRASYGLSPQSLDHRLCRAAQEQAAYLLRTGQFHHYVNGNPRRRAAKYGFPVRHENDLDSVQENLAGGHSIQVAFTGWMNSPGHLANILKNRPLCGFGVEYGGQYGAIWCALYGKENLSAASEPANLRAAGSAARVSPAAFEVQARPRYPNIQVYPPPQNGPAIPIQNQWNDPVRINELVRDLKTIQGKFEQATDVVNPQLLVKTEHGHRFIKGVALMASKDVVIELLQYTGQAPAPAPASPVRLPTTDYSRAVYQNCPSGVCVQPQSVRYVAAPGSALRAYRNTTRMNNAARQSYQGPARGGPVRRLFGRR